MFYGVFIQFKIFEKRVVMIATSKDRVKNTFWELNPSKLDKIEWDIRVGDKINPVVALRSDAYHARVLELNINEIGELLEPLGYKVVKL